MVSDAGGERVAAKGCTVVSNDNLFRYGFGDDSGADGDTVG